VPREAVAREAWADSAQELELRHRAAAPGQLLTPQNLVCGLPLRHPLAVCSRAVGQVRQTLEQFCRLHICQVQEQRRQKRWGHMTSRISRSSVILTLEVAAAEHVTCGGVRGNWTGQAAAGERTTVACSEA